MKSHNSKSILSPDINNKKYIKIGLDTKYLPYKQLKRPLNETN